MAGGESAPTRNGAVVSATPVRKLTPQEEEHEAFKNRLVDDVLGEGAGDKVPMEKVVMLIWQFRDDPSVITFMARFMGKYAGVRHVLDGIEFYLPQLAHMIIHLEVEWDDAILERFVLVIAQQSIHFALQLNWILQGALQDYQPEQLDGSPNETYNPKFYTRCLKLLKNLERCVVYGKPVSQELQRLYERGQINQSERELLEQADRRFNALQITTNPDDTNYGAEGTLDGWVDVDFDGTGDFASRFASLNRSVLDFFTTGNSCGGGGLKLDRAVALQGRTIGEGEGGCMILIKQTKDNTVSIRCSSVEDKTLWIRRLKEESNTGGLFSRRDLKNDLTQTQLDRYEFFESERTFVKSLTDLAEELRFKDRMERKKLAPELAEHIKIPSIAYLPLCNSSDIWRRVACVIPKPTRVFNTKERCPVIFYFVSSRGEKVKRTKNDPNLDVAEFLHAYFNVTKNEIDHVPEESQNSDETGQTEDVTTDDPIKQSEHSGAWAAENEEMVEVPITPAERHPKGNIKVQRLLKESVVTLPTKLAKRLGRGPRKSVMDRQTEMQPVVQILENRWAGESDNASVGDGTVVSVERSSILVKDRILFGGLDEGKIDLESMDRAKKHICNGKTWAEQSATMLEEIQVDASEGVQHEIISCMSKSNDDLRQEVFVMQMIHYFKSVFAQANLPLWLKTYRILSTSSSDGLIEVLVDATSIDGLKKSEGYPEEGGLRKYFETVYGGPDSEAFKEAQNNFMQSLAGYALVSYLLGLKDRHNGNIMIDTRGHLIFIDFGFAFGMAPGHEFSMERAPFKFTKEYVDVLGGPKSKCYKEFQELFVAGLEEARKNSQIALGLVEIMMFQSNYPCFSGWRYGKGRALTKFEKRLLLKVPDHLVKKRALRLIRRAWRHGGTHLYDAFQRATNGYAM